MNANVAKLASDLARDARGYAGCSTSASDLLAMAEGAPPPPPGMPFTKQELCLRVAQTLVARAERLLEQAKAVEAAMLAADAAGGVH